MKEESTSDAITHLLEECRMVLPGIQALFGFQLIVVFNPGFREHLTSSEQLLHLLAVTLTAFAVALVMIPAGYHRQTRDDPNPEKFISLSSRLLLWSIFPLMAALCLDVYLIARLVLGSLALSLFLAIALLGIFIFWILLTHSDVFRGSSLIKTAVLGRWYTLADRERCPNRSSPVGGPPITLFEP